MTDLTNKLKSWCDENGYKLDVYRWIERYRPNRDIAFYELIKKEGKYCNACIVINPDKNNISCIRKPIRSEGNYQISRLPKILKENYNSLKAYLAEPEYIYDYDGDDEDGKPIYRKVKVE